jgi:putative flippase GtrA
VKLISPTQLRFGLVGIGNTAVDLLGYAALVSLGLPIFVANFISTTAGLILSFTLNRSFTFKSRTGNIKRQVTLFVLVTGFGLWVMQPVIILLVTHAIPGVNILVPKAAGILVGLVWNYVLYNKVVFKHSEEPVQPLPSADSVEAG